MKRSGSPQMPRSIDGHGSVTTSRPPCGGSTRVPSSSRTSIVMPGIGTCAEPGLSVVRPGQRADHDRAGLGLPPGVDDRGRAAADHLAVPHPRLGVDRLADRAEQAQARQVELLRDLAAELHERADRGGRGVEDAHPVLLDDLPPAAGVRGVGGALVEHLGRAVGERAVDHVAVAGDPADVGGAPVDVGLGVQVEDVLVGERDLGEVAAAGVQDALRACPWCRRCRG